LEKLIGDLLIFLATIDPIGTLALFVGLTGDISAAERSRLALRSVGISAAVLVTFIVIGQVVLAGLGIRLESFQFAGGIIFFLFGLQMVFGSGSLAATPASDDHHDVAVFPLAVPSIASPGAILACVVLTDNNEFSLLEQSKTCGVLLVVLVGTLLVLLQADRVFRLIGKSGCALLVRVLGLVLASLAVEMTVEAGEKLLAR